VNCWARGEWIPLHGETVVYKTPTIGTTVLSRNSKLIKAECPALGNFFPVSAIGLNQKYWKVISFFKLVDFPWECPTLSVVYLSEGSLYPIYGEHCSIRFSSSIGKWNFFRSADQLRFNRCPRSPSSLSPSLFCCWAFQKFNYFVFLHSNVSNKRIKFKSMLHKQKLSATFARKVGFVS